MWHRHHTGRMGLRCKATAQVRPRLSTCGASRTPRVAPLLVPQHLTASCLRSSWVARSADSSATAQQEGAEERKHKGSADADADGKGGGSSTQAKADNSSEQQQQHEEAAKLEEEAEWCVRCVSCPQRPRMRYSIHSPSRGMHRHILHAHAHTRTLMLTIMFTHTHNHAYALTHSIMRRCAPANALTVSTHTRKHKQSLRAADAESVLA